MHGIEGTDQVNEMELFVLFGWRVIIYQNGAELQGMGLL